MPGGGLPLDDEVDDGRERHVLAVLEPPLGFAEVARGEGQVPVSHGHRDRDEVALPAGRTGAARLTHGGSFGRGSAREHSSAPSSRAWAATAPDTPRPEGNRPVRGTRGCDLRPRPADGGAVRRRPRGGGRPRQPTPPAAA